MWLIVTNGFRLFDLEGSLTSGKVLLVVLIIGGSGTLLIAFCAIMVNLLYFPRTWMNYFVNIVLSIYTLYGCFYFLGSVYPE